MFVVPSGFPWLKETLGAMGPEKTSRDFLVITVTSPSL